MNAKHWIAAVAMAWGVAVPASGLAHEGHEHRHEHSDAPDVATEHGEDPHTDHGVIPGELRTAIGYEFSTGDYGARRDTDVHYLPLTLEWLIDAWSFSVVIPWLWVDGPASFVGPGEPSGDNGDRNPPTTRQPNAADSARGVANRSGQRGGAAMRTGDRRGANPMPPPRPRPRRTSKEDGIGDIVVEAGYMLPPFVSERLYLELEGEVKIPTADKGKGLGTGETDVAFGFDAAVAAGDYWPYLTAAWRIIGRSDDFNLQDGPRVAAGVIWQATDAFGVGVEAEYRRAVSEAADDPVELISYVSWSPAPYWTIGAHGVAGLTDGSPDLALGTTIGYAFD